MPARRPAWHLSSRHLSLRRAPHAPTARWAYAIPPLHSSLVTRHSSFAVRHSSLVTQERGRPMEQGQQDPEAARAEAVHTTYEQQVAATDAQMLDELWE